MFSVAARTHHDAEEYIDDFVRVHAPRILRGAGYDGAADLLAGLTPLVRSGGGRQWRSVSLPLARHAGILRADTVLQQARLRGTSAIQALGRAGSGFEFVSRHFPAIHAETERAVEILTEAHEVAPLIAECVRLAIVATVLQRSSQQRETGLPVDLVCLENRLANSALADQPQSMPWASGIDVLVASYLNAPLYFDHDGGWSDVG